MELNESMDFSSRAEKRRCEEKAIAGDVECAKHLADYYYFIVRDHKSAKRWYQVCASYGDKDCIANVKFIEANP